MLRKVFAQGNRGAEGIYNEEFYNLYSPNSIQMIESRRMRWGGHVWGTGEVHTGF